MQRGVDVTAADCARLWIAFVVVVAADPNAIGACLQRDRLLRLPLALVVVVRGAALERHGAISMLACEDDVVAKVEAGVRLGEGEACLRAKVIVASERIGAAEIEAGRGVRDLAPGDALRLIGPNVRGGLNTTTTDHQEGNQSASHSGNGSGPGPTPTMQLPIAVGPRMLGR